ncbi:uncharacterized protein LOC134026546 [Osmerus eperlanus]|uniref:uncharacterized protein LOC134026546 n=1 Tax=Osmerus eperlanus TaxID=29151 RepID=UPI002E153561
MENASIANSMKTISHRLGVEKSSYENGSHGHLRPLSVYARRMVSCGNVQSNINHLWENSNPFCNLKIEIVTSSDSKSQKRRLDDSCLDDTYETPAKKLWNPQNTVSPDLACVIDSWNPLPEIHQASSGPKTVSSGVKNLVVDHEEGRTPGSGLSVKHVKSELSGVSDGRQGGMLPGSLYPNPLELDRENVALDYGTAFDCDIDDIMCLSPIHSDSSSNDSIDDLISSCQSLYEYSNSDKAGGQNYSVLDQSLLKESAQKQGLVKQRAGEQKRFLGGESFSGSFLNALREQKKDVCEAETPLRPQAFSSSTLVSVRAKGVQLLASLLEDRVERKAPCPLEPKKGQAEVCQQHLSFSLEDSLDTCGALLIPVEGAEECLDGATGEVWNIGDPLLQSSVCHCSTDPLVEVCDERSEGKEEGKNKGGVISSAQEWQVEEVAVETSYETTLPLQVQVRSVVVVPDLQISNKSPTLQSPPKQNESKSPPQPREVQKKTQFQHKESNKKDRKATMSRPVVFDREKDWQHEKRVYADSVTRHMKENVGVGQGVMTELHNLMDHVAHQGPGFNGQQWQHPSDLTRRNYEVRFGNEVLKFSLDQWRYQSYRKHKRFALVPKLFKRNTKN